MDAPKCRLCQSKHWSYEVHKIPVGVEGAQAPAPGPAPAKLTYAVKEPAIPNLKTEHLKTEHGGNRQNAGRKASPLTKAERQRAYRERARA